MRIRPEEFEYYYFTDKDGNKIAASEASNDPDAMYVEDDVLSDGALVFRKDIYPSNPLIFKLAAMNNGIRIHKPQFSAQNRRYYDGGRNQTL